MRRKRPAAQKVAPLRPIDGHDLIFTTRRGRRRRVIRRASLQPPSYRASAGRSLKLYVNPSTSRGWSTPATVARMSPVSLANLFQGRDQIRLLRIEAGRQNRCHLLLARHMTYGLRMPDRPTV
jgi:hypothetical protein